MTRRAKKGRVKDGSICPSRMKVFVSNEGLVNVTYFKSHSHPIQSTDVQYHPLPQSEKENIKNKLLIGIPPDSIHKELREGLGDR